VPGDSFLERFSLHIGAYVHWSSRPKYLKQKIITSHHDNRIICLHVMCEGFFFYSHTYDRKTHMHVGKHFSVKETRDEIFLDLLYLIVKIHCSPMIFPAYWSIYTLIFKIHISQKKNYYCTSHHDNRIICLHVMYEGFIFSILIHMTKYVHAILKTFLSERNTWRCLFGFALSTINIRCSPKIFPAYCSIYTPIFKIQIS
jgi:hypothetical protein